MADFLECVLCSGQKIRIFSETEVKFHVAPQWDREKDGKLIRMILVICCYSLLSIPGGGGIKQGFYHKFGSAVQGIEN